MADEQAPLSVKEQKDVHKLIETLFADLEIDGTFSVSEGESGIDILLETKDTGIVIGYHGEILESLQLISSLLVSRKIGRFVRVSIEVGEYKKNRSAYLERLAEQVRDRVLTEEKEQEIPNLKSWERRIVHMYLQEDERVESESVGVGKDRVLVVRPRA
jgi:spoIIIJ-associated protein